MAVWDTKENSEIFSGDKVESNHSNNAYLTAGSLGKEQVRHLDDWPVNVRSPQEENGLILVRPMLSYQWH